MAAAARAGQRGASDLWNHLAGLPVIAIACALVASAVSYVALAGVDAAALIQVRRRLPLAKVGLTSFLSLAMSHNLGFAPLTGGSIRYRFYSASGLTTIEIATAIAPVGWSFSLGVAAISGLVLLFLPEPFVLAVPYIPDLAWRLIGVALLAAIAGYLYWIALVRRPFRLWRWWFQVPSFTTTVWQILFTAADIGLAAAVLYFLLPQDGGVSFAVLLAVFVASMLVGMLSQVPAGLGVFETLMLWLLPSVSHPELIGAIVGYRIAYYILPLIIAAVLLSIYELRFHLWRLEAAPAPATPESLHRP